MERRGVYRKNTALMNYKSIVNGEQAYNGKEAKAKAKEKSAKAKGISNCPLCAIGHNANAKRIYKKNEMDADRENGILKLKTGRPPIGRSACFMVYLINFTLRTRWRDSRG